MKRLIALILTGALAVGIMIYFKTHNEVMDKEPAVCFVVEADNLYGADFGLLSGIVNDFVTRHGIVMCVVADGEPYVLFNKDIPDRGNRLIGSRKRKNDIKEDTDDIIAKLQTAAPKTPENDLIGAINLASRELIRCRSATDRTIIVVSSGISRAGVFNFLDFSGTVEGATVTNILGYNPEKIVRKLEAAKAIPDLTGINKMDWYGFGKALGAQQISESEAKSLQDLWGAVTEYSGLPASFKELEAEEGWPDAFVNPEEIIRTELQSTVITFGTQTPVETDITGTEILLTEQRIGFVPDQAKLINQDKASRALEQYALDLKEWSPGNGKILIVGVIDSEEADEQHRAVALERAVMVKNLLISLDCPAAAFETATIKSDYDSSDSSGEETVTQVSPGQETAVLILGSSAAEKYELN